MTLNRVSQFVAVARATVQAIAFSAEAGKACNVDCDGGSLQNAKAGTGMKPRMDTDAIGIMKDKQMGRRNTGRFRKRGASGGGEARVMLALKLAVPLILAVPALLIGGNEPSGITLTSSPDGSVFGRSVTLLATVTPPVASGSVTFYDGAEVLGTSRLTGGEAKLTTSLIPSGSRSLKAYYGGDSNYAPSTSVTLVHNVDAASGGGSQPAVDSPADANPRSEAMGDVKRDGKPDLTVAIFGNGDNESVLLGLAPASNQAITDSANLTQGPERKSQVSAFPIVAPARPLTASENPDSATGTGIVYTCDATITTLSATACNTLNTTIAALYSSAFTNINASIYVTLGTTGLGASTWAVNEFSYSSFRTALIAKASGANDTTADTNSLPAANPFGSDLVGVAGALQGALGLSTAGGSGLEADGTTTCTLGTAGCYDGIATLSNTTPYYFRIGEISTSQYDFFTVVEHETDEILGTPSCALVGCTGLVFPADFFRYHSNGTRSFGAGTANPCSASDSTNACFSLDGVHMLQQYQNIAGAGDGGDWLIDCGSPLVQDEALCPGVAGVDISPPAEVLVLDVIGYARRTPSISGAVMNVASSTPNGTYGVGTPISIQISFSEAVTVTGTPLLALNSGGRARYRSGSGTSTLTFDYGVDEGQSTTRLDCWSTGGLALNGGSIQGPGGTAEDVTLPRPGVAGSLGGNAEIVINTSRRSRSEPPEIAPPVKR